MRKIKQFEDGTCIGERVGKYKKRPIKIRALKLTECVLIETPEGTMKGLKGDWLLEGINKEVYPCKPDIFRQTYEQVI